MLIEQGAGFGVVLHCELEVSHLVIQVADGAVKGRAHIVNIVLRIAVRAGGGGGAGFHKIYVLHGFGEVYQRTVVLLLAPKVLTYVAKGIGIGERPVFTGADFHCPAGIEDALFLVQLAVSAH